ncbi:MAG TPA: DNA repair protein [Nitrosopumilus sp.]|nr:DNA repair protein [Thermoproteota archaeon]HJJ22360.1 DNA repair protein [Nitrosopumilus sp.]
MGFFTKKKVDELFSEKEEATLEVVLEDENIQNEIETKSEELDNIIQKIQTVKEEYNYIVGNLMSVKKELNQKKMELDVIKIESRKIDEKNKKSIEIKDSKSINEFRKTEASLTKMKEELDETTKEYDRTKKQIEQAQFTLHSTKNQQIEYQKELDEARIRLYNAKDELEKKDNFQDTSILTPKEREFIEGNTSNQKSSAGVIEAASVVVGTLKSKLNMTQKELEAIQLLLEQERAEHERTKLEIEKIK